MILRKLSAVSLAVKVRIGKAKQYEVAKSIPVRMYWNPDLDRSRGPTTSNAIFLNLSQIISGSFKGAGFGFALENT